MKKQKVNNNAEMPTMEYWLKLKELYFAAETTDEEEELLKKFLCTSAADGKEFDDIKATMGYISVAKGKHQKQKERKKIRIGWIMKIGSAAAAIALLLVMATNSKQPAATPKQPTETAAGVCVAYIDGKVYTDEDFVLNQMQNTIAKVIGGTEKNSIEEQMSSILNISEG